MMTTVNTKMTNREMLMELKKVEPMFDKLIDVAHEIVESTFDVYCCGVDDLVVGDKTVEVQYEYHCHGEYAHSIVIVPIEWFDEGFDYKAAYKEMKRKEAEEEKKLEEAKKKRKAAAKKAAEKRKAKKEYETYLKLKQKYESKQPELHVTSVWLDEETRKKILLPKVYDENGNRLA